MIVEQRVYRLKKGMVPEYIRLYREHGRAVQVRILGNPLGYYTTEVGDLNEVVHLWGYASWDDRAERRSKLFQDSDWLVFMEKSASLVEVQENRILKPVFDE